MTDNEECPFVNKILLLMTNIKYLLTMITTC